MGSVIAMLLALDPVLSAEAVAELRSAPRESVRLVVARCESVEVRHHGTRSQSTLAKVKLVGDGSPLTLTRYSQGPALMKVGAAYFVAAYAEGPLFQVVALEALEPFDAKAGAAMVEAARALVFDAPGVLTRLVGGDAAAAKYKPPSTLVFKPLDAVLNAGVFELSGTLTNTGEVDEKVIVFADDTALLIQYFPKAAVTYAPSAMRPPEPPAAHELLVRAHQSVRVGGVFDTKWLVYEGAPVITVEWTLMYWNAPRPHGSWSLTLPKR